MKKCFISTTRASVHTWPGICACILVLLLIPGSVQKGWAELNSHKTSNVQSQNFKNVKKVTGKTTFIKDFGNIPLYFIPNKGQMNEKALFCAKTPVYTLWLTKNGMIFDSARSAKNPPTKQLSPNTPHSVKTERDVSRLIFLNANKNPLVVPAEPTTHRVNYLNGSSKSQWYTNIPTSKQVCYRDLYQGIDLTVYGNEKQIEYDWIVKPGGDPGDICFAYRDISSSFIDKNGDLIIQTSFGQWTHKKPLAYQVIDGKRMIVDAVFKKHSPGKNTYGFELKSYDKNYELVIDPMIIAFSNILGGNYMDRINGMAVDATGAIYVIGFTESSDFPTENALQNNLLGYGDSFAAKFSPDGKDLVFSTYLGGNSYDAAYGIALDYSGNIYIGGITYSTDFPTVNAYQASSGGKNDGFIAKLSNDGSTLLYSTYLGGSEDEAVRDLVLNGSGEICVTGETNSSDFPLVNALQSNLTDGDAFVAKFSSSGASLLFSTFLGGDNGDHPYGIAVDGGNAVYVAGSTGSTDFPTMNPYQSSLGGGSGDMDGFITKIAADGSSLVYSTYLGGVEMEELFDIDVDSTGAAYVTGFTASTDFPTTPGTFQEFKPGSPGNTDVYVTKLAASGSSLVYSTFLNGTDGYSDGEAITVTANGSAYVTGRTSSSTFPLVDAFQEELRGYEDVFITGFSNDGANITFSSYLGSWDYDMGNDICVDSAGNIYVAGSGGPGFPVFQGYRNPPSDFEDGFVTKIVYSDISGITVIAPNGGEEWFVGDTETITWSAPDTIENVRIQYYSDYNYEWITIAESTPNDGSYSWTIPDTPSYECLVQVRDVDWENDQWDESDNYFSISWNPLTVNSPNGGECLVTGSMYDITWTDDGFLMEVSIDYSIDGGNTWLPIASSIPNTRSYTWIIPYTPSSNCLVRVSDPWGPISDISDNPFNIIDAGYSLQLITPNGGEIWEAGTNHEIGCAAGSSIISVSYDYSIDGGTTWITIVLSTSGSKPFNWTVPHTPSGNCLVRVSDVGGMSADISDSVFTISSASSPGIAVTSPNGGEECFIGLQHEITWTYSGAIEYVTLDYSVDHGITWIRIATSIPNTGSFNWTVPDDPSEDCKIKVSDPEGMLYDTSDGLFSISVARIPTSERNALIALYNSTNGDSWWNNYNWRMPGNPSEFNYPGTEYTWAGIICNEERTHVTEIDLSFNNLSGALPDLSALTELRNICIYYNQLTGNIPGTFNNLTNLTAIDLSDNQLTGLIPDLSALDKLESLYLSNNNLSGNLPASMSGLTGLTTLFLENNQLSGEIPDLSSLSNLVFLFLNNNQFSGNIPAWLNQMTDIYYVHLYGNQLTGSIPDLSNMSQLLELCLSDNQLTGNIPPELANLTSLKLLTLNGNKLEGSLPAGLTNLTNLYNSWGLDIRWNGLYTDDPGLRSFLNSKQYGGDWEGSQTIAPSDLFIDDVTQHSVTIFWTPIQYQGDTGGYRVYYSTTSGGNYTLAGTTTDKTAINYNVTGLAPGTTYYFVVETVTNAHSNNQNTVVSEYSTEISAVTLE